MKPLIFACLILIIPINALACSTSYSATQQQVVPTSPNQKLFSLTLLIAVNNTRCRLGKTPLRHSALADKTALIHSENMARTKMFSHQSSISSLRTVKERAQRAKLRWNWIGENIALIPRYSFKHRAKFRTLDKASCIFAYPKTEKKIPPHTYATLAETTLERWMASRGHRANILSTKAHKLGAGLFFEGSGETCGHFYITQVFAD